MVGIVFFIMTSLNLNYFFHLDALLLVTIGTIGYALANTHSKTIIANIGDGAVYFGWIGDGLVIDSCHNHSKEWIYA